jgi:serine-type D-Ala-D-Ala carboxypeptidase/endopeptidase (penicillin-binding protein 4)
MFLRLTVVLFTWSLCIHATLKSDIDALIHKVDSNLNMGVYITDANTGKVLFSQNENRYYIPASVLKIFTDAIALDILGPDFTFKTQLWQQAKTNNRILKFSGDPTLMFSDLVELFKKLPDSKSIGTLVIDTTDPYPLKSPPANWMIDDQDFCHGIAALPMIINRNSLRFSLTARQSNQKPLIEVKPGHFVHIEGSPRVRKTCKPMEAFRRKHILLSYPTLTLESSCLEPSGQPIQLCIPVLRDQLQAYIKDMVYQALKQANVKFADKVVIVFKPVQSYKQDTLLVEHTSENLLTILKQAMADSDNLIMDSLMLQVLKRIEPNIQEWRDIGPVIQRWARERLQTNLRHSVITEGAGLSHVNLLTPAQIGTFLRRIYGDTKLSKLFYESLPTPGTDGTLGGRLKGLEQQVRVKTGTLRRNVLGLAGYLTTCSGGRLAFSFMTTSNFYDDGVQDRRKAYLDLEHAILERLAAL